MGCVSSKHLKKQAHLEGHWDRPPVKRKTDHRTSNSELSFEDHHRHLVALTSSSYGLLKMDLPKTLEGGKKSTARVGSMNDMYDKLDVLESVEVAPSSWNEVNSVLQTLKPGLGRSISMPMPSSNNTGVQETIDVADIMQGLEEDEASGYSSSCDKPQPPSPPPPPGVLSTRKHKKVGKASRIIQDLDALQANVDAVATRKSARFSSEDLSRGSPHEAGSRRIMPALGRLNKDVKTLNPDGLPLVIQKNGRRGSAVQCQNEQTQRVSTENAMASQKAVVEDRSMRRDDEAGLNPKVPSNITYLTSSRRRLKLTLNLEYEKNTFFAGTQISQDACSSVGSSARISLVDVLAEPESPLFDPALLASYEKALRELRKEDWCINDDLPDRTRLSKEYDMHLEETPARQVSAELQLGLGEPSDDDATRTNPSMIQSSYDPLDEFEWKCPPGGEESVVLYTTTLRGIRKTFEDCNYLRETLRSFTVVIDERDVSMHLTYRNELKELMGGAVPVPRVFIKGRYIGGKDDVVKLHEENKLCDILEDLPKELNAEICDGCGGVRFVPCLECSGSCKIVDESNSVLRCPECNENGLIQCPICS